MLVAEYEARLKELARHISFLIPTEVEKVRHLIEGLTYGISITMAQKSEMCVTFH